MFEKKKYLQSSGADNKTDEAFYYYATVVDINDPIDGKRIRARIKGVDDKISDEKLPWCTSFLPLNIVTNPKVGEMVKIFFPSKFEVMNKREWCGPVITSFLNLKYESSRSALSNQDVSNITSPKSIKKIPSAKAAYMDDKDVGMQGRDNTDIVLKPREILIRAGKFVFDDNTKANEKNPSYIQLKLSDDGKVSYSSLVGDKVILLSHQGAKTYKAILDDDVLKKIIETANSAAYAEPIVEYLKLVQDFVINHVHPQNLPPNKAAGKINEIAAFDFNKIIAKNIKIN